MKYPGFIDGESYFPTVDFQRTINLYPETMPSGQKRLRGTPGLLGVVTLPTVPTRGLWAGSNLMWAASGTKLYSVSSSYAVAELGTIGDDSSHTPVLIESNASGTHKVVYASGQLYLHNAGVLSAAGMPTASWLAHLDTYFIRGVPNSGQFAISSPNDGSAWDAADIATAESCADHIVRGFVNDRGDLYLFGEETTEVWRNTGNADFPFQPMKDATLPMGIIAPWSVSGLGGGVGWLGTNPNGGPAAYLAIGYQMERVSTPVLETDWAQYQYVYEVKAFSFVMGGHEFWQLNFPDFSYRYDLTESKRMGKHLWHRVAYGSSLDKHRAVCHTSLILGTQFQHFVGDYNDGRIYTMAEACADDDGTAMRRIRGGPILTDEEKKIFYTGFTLESHVEPKLDNGAVSAELRYTDDRGVTWETEGTKLIQTGRGNAQNRCIWNRLGSARARAYEVEIADAAKVEITDAYIDLAKGTS